MMQLPLVETNNGSVVVRIQNEERWYTRQPLPHAFVEWQINERLSLYKLLEQGGRPMFLAPHLPTLITVHRDYHDFPLNAANKGVGLVPVNDLLPPLIQQIGSILSEIQTLDFKESLPKRLEALTLLYGDQETIDYHLLGGLEIFETQSFTNIVQDPRVSLFFVGGAPNYQSYQINCIAEIVSPPDKFYEFVSSMRALFEPAQFHYQQPMYPYAIKYHVVQIFDKSLQVRER